MKLLKALIFLVNVCFCLSLALASAQTSWQMQPATIETRWAKDVSPSNALPDYPRPQTVRKQWQNLNGLWDYAVTAKDAAQPASFQGKILVPYPIESALSGVEKPLLPDQLLWYRRTFARPQLKEGERLLLHFGAVDWQATVFVNGKQVGKHKGGYQRFSFDITDALKPGANELVVKVYDPTDQGPNPHGKQTLHPERISYTATSGIWQTVWLETVPAVHIASLKFTPDVDHGVLHLIVQCAGEENGCPGYAVEALAESGKRKVGTVKGDAGAELELNVPDARLWSPSDPYLYNLSVELKKGSKTVDHVASYFGMRKIEVKKDEKSIERIFLNGKYTYNLGVLDQGFWPDGIYTAPTDNALKFDIEAIKGMGFNTIRKHIKVEPDRWYYWCDKLGMLVWQDMPQPGNTDPDGKAEFETESAANINQLYDHPSIVTWVLFNEGWGAYDQTRLAKWIKGLDPSRLLDGHTGGYVNAPAEGEDVAAKWVDSDMTDIHAYPDPNIPPSKGGKARVLGEYGGIGVLVSGHQWDDMNGWGYVRTTPAEMVTRYAAMAEKLKKFEGEGLSGSIYTQPYDVETESNGLMTYDRKMLKIPVAKLQQMNQLVVASTSRGDAAEAVLKSIPVADPDPKHEFQSRLAKYNGGERDPASLRRSALLGHSLRHDDVAEKMASMYIAQITGEARFTKANIEFFRLFTKSASDLGFELFNRNGDRVDQVMQSPGYSRGFTDFLLAKQKYENGDRDLAVSRLLLQRFTVVDPAALSSQEQALEQRVGADFVNSVIGAGQLTRDDIQLLKLLTRTSKDKGFDLFYRQGDRLDQIMDAPGYSHQVVDGIIRQEEVTPVLQSSNLPNASEPNWIGFREGIASKYDAASAERAFFVAKANWYFAKQDWGNFAESVSEKLRKYPPHVLDTEDLYGLGGLSDSWVLNTAAWNVFLHCNDKDVLSQALTWIDAALDVDRELNKKMRRGEGPNLQLVDTKANLLYKVGRVREAIALEQSAADDDIRAASNRGDKDFVSGFGTTVAKMEKGEPTWPSR